jgi:hypothetical protein
MDVGTGVGVELGMGVGVNVGMGVGVNVGMGVGLGVATAAAAKGYYANFVALQPCCTS